VNRFFKKMLSFAFALLALLILWYCLKPAPTTPNQAVVPAPLSKPPSPVAINPSPADSAPPLVTDPIPVFPYEGSSDPRWPLRRKLQEQDPQYEWRTPISFYGKVIDQDGQPISGVRLRMSWTDLSPKGTSLANQTTDARGLFSITGITGKRLGVGDLEKAGYVAARGTNPYTFEYPGFWEPSYHIPDPENPVIFRMHRRGEAEPLTYRRKTFFDARADGVPTHYNFAQWKEVPSGGDLTVRISRGPRENRRFAWEADVEVPGGGLIESSEEFMVEAPDEGYLPRWSFAQTGSELHFLNDVHRTFYFRSRDGKFGRLYVRLLPRYNEGAKVDLELYLNPSGSRNLEIDPTKVVEITPESLMR